MHDQGSASEASPLAGLSGTESGSHSTHLHAPPPSGPPASNPDHTVISREPPYSLVDAPPAPQNVATTLVPGQRVGPFVIEEKVGGGGMGAVFRARDVVLQRSAAIKVLSPAAITDPEVVRRFQVEAQSAARLDHENIARVYFAGEDQGHQFIAFEYIQGKNVRDIVAEFGPLPLRTVISHTIQLASALAHASRRDVVHRDVKPSNVILAPSGRVKLVDMGLARLASAERSSGDLTASGVTLGTFDYISPEQARDPRLADVRSDLYSLGCTMYFMLTGRPPFPEGTVLQKLLQHQGDLPPDPRELRPDLPEEIVPIMRRLLAKSPEQRYQTPQQLMEDLWTFSQMMGFPLLGMRAAEFPATRLGAPTWWQNHSPWILAAATLLIMVVGYDAFSTWRQSREGNPWDEPRGLSMRPASEIAAVQQPPNVADASSEKRQRSTSAQTDDGHQVGMADRSDQDVAQGGPHAPSPREDNGNSDGRTTRSANPTVANVPGRAPMESFDHSEASERQNGGDAGGDTRTSRDSEAQTPPERAPNAAHRDVAKTGPGEEAASSDGGGVTLPNAESERTTAIARSDGLWIISQADADTLSEACQRAKSGGIIELRFDGLLDTKPLIVHEDVTIRGQPGSHPILRFRATDTDYGAFRRSMITAAGRLSLINVHLELTKTERGVFDQWSMFHVDGPGLDIEDCSLTIRGDQNAVRNGAQRTTFLRVDAPEATMMSNMGAPTLPATVGIRLENTVVRGDADLLSVHGMKHVEFDWTNGILTVDGHLFVADGLPKTSRLMAPVSVDLRHVTAYLGDAACSLRMGDDHETDTLVDVVVRDSIVKPRHDKPLVETPGVDASGWLKCPVAWSDDHTYYDGVTSFWRWGSSTPGGKDGQISFRAWRLDRDGPGQIVSNQVFWRSTPGESRPMQSFLPRDFALSESSGRNPALHGAKNGRNAGCIPDELPEIPVDLASLEWFEEFLGPD